MEAGDKLYCSATQQPYSVWGQIIEFDNTANVKSVNSVDISAAGNNLVYTSPSTGRGSIVFPSPILAASSTSEGSAFTGINLSGNGDIANVFPMIVPSGSVAGATFKASAAVSLNDSGGGAGAEGAFTQIGPNLRIFLSPNDAIYFNSDGGAAANVYVTFNVVEL